VVSLALAQRGLAAVALNSVLAGIAYRTRGLDRVGALTGGLLGTALYLALGGAGFALLAAFYVLGSGATLLGLARKQARGLAQTRGGRRGARNVLANAGVAVVWASIALATPLGEPAVLACAAALAAATGDTLASEIGQLVGGRTRLIVNFSAVKPGTEGGVSFWGSAAGLGGCVAIAGLGTGLDLYPAAGLPAVALAGVVGVCADSVLGATLEQRGLLGNEGVNFTATLVASLTALLLA
jgi:uncharacterized protein (TIGR00297 family)